MANRTLQFFGSAYGDVPVQINAHINGTLVFSGSVATIAGDIPVDIPVDQPILFSVAESALYPTSYSGAYPMTISVATGYGIAVCATSCNYMGSGTDQVEFSGSISGTTLTVSSVTSGEVTVGQQLNGTGITGGTTIVSGNGSSWVVSKDQTVGETTINGSIPVTGTADVFSSCFNGTPANSEGTPDSRSSVQLNGVAQVPPLEPSYGEWTWLVDSGSTLECNFNVSEGSE
jgi:hypothetical protein